MTARTKIFLVLATLAIAGSVFVWLPVARRTSGSRNSASGISNERSAVENSRPPLNSKPRQLEESEESKISEEQADHQKDRIFLKALEREQVPLDFYGRVVDENGNGVAGATVQVSASQFNILKAADMFVEAKKMTLQTDPRGNFSVTGLRGYSLVIHVEKEGYFTSSKNPSGFGYVGAPKQNFRGNPQEPVIFQLRRERGAEALVHPRGKGYAIPRDGTPVFVDLLAGTTNMAVTDLKIQAWTSDGIKDEKYRYDWRARFEVIDGGLQETRGEFDFMAPEDGYEAVYEMDFPRSRGKDWRSDVAKNFFIISRNGQVYGRIHLRMIAGGDHFCWIEAWLNPSGSRNLEPDPKLLFPNIDAYNRYMAKQKQVAK
jgi:hypothetical protein